MVKALVLLSGGIDSPVAAHIVSRFADIACIHFDNRPFTDGSFSDRCRTHVRQMSSVLSKPVVLYIVPFGQVQTEISRNCERRYQCVICRRMMLRIASRLSLKVGMDILVTGDSIGQVASQTLSNLTVETSAAEIPVIRPLIAMDKEEVIGLAKEMGTFQTSISPGVCCMLAPPKPATKARLQCIHEEESKIDIDGVTDRALRKVEMHVFRPQTVQDKGGI